MNKPDALRLADELDAELRRTVQVDMLHHNAAAELRRLHSENERLERENFAWRTKLGIRGYEIRIAELQDQRDALLEALKGMVNSTGAHGGPYVLARDAIKAVEENTCAL